MARILVVDDHHHIVRLLQRELEAEEHVVVTATTGEEALQKVWEEAPDLLVLDVMLPGKSGFEVLRELKADPTTRGMAVILLTALDHPNDISRGLQLGADWYLTKPFRPGDIATVAQRFLDTPRHPVATSGGALLPLVEIDLFTMTAADAFDLAVRGKVAEGFGCLQAGLRRADGARNSGEPWADELVRRYEEVRDHYVARHGAPPA